MNPRSYLFAVLFTATLALIFLPAGKLSAQAQDGNPYSPPIDMVVDWGRNGELQRTSHFGIMDPVGLRPNQQIAIRLAASSSKANYPVGIAPLDGGGVLAPENLSVANDGTTSFAFTGGSTPGLYRVVVSIGSERYRLQFYVTRPQDISLDCVLP